MRVGLTLDMRNAPQWRRPWRQLWEDSLWLLVEAEAMGFDSILIQEHFFCDDGYAPSQPVFLTAAIERTTRIRVGAYLYILPLHHPAQLAQETAVLDHLSEGRLDVTVGIGHRVKEYQAWGYDPRTRPSRMEEGLDVLRLAWTQHPFSYHGRYWAIDDVEVRPEPLQQPYPPLWVAATTPAAAERAGRHGAHLAGAATDPAVHEAYRDARAAAGHDPSSARISQPYSVTVTDEDPEKVWARYEDLFFYRWDFYRRIRAEFGDPDLDYGLEPSPSAYREYELIGDADTVLGTIEPFVNDLGLTDIVLFGPPSGMDLRNEGYEHLKRFAEQVLPTIKSW